MLILYFDLFLFYDNGNDELWKLIYKKKPRSLMIKKN